MTAARKAASESSASAGEGRRAEPAAKTARAGAETDRGSRREPRSQRDGRRDDSISDGAVRAVLYDARKTDREVALSRRLIHSLDEGKLLWVDIDTEAAAEAGPRAAALFGVDEMLTAASEPSLKPEVTDRGAYITVSMKVPRRSSAQLEFLGLTCFSGNNWVITAHAGELDFLVPFAEHISVDSQTGKLDALAFLASVLDWGLHDYFSVIDEMQHDIDGIEQLFLARSDEEERLERLVALRRRVSLLRTSLSSHRQAFGVLSRPSFEVVSGSGSAAEFQLLSDRLESALQAVDTTREMIVGAFDLLMTRTAQRTNDIMRILTIVSVLLLPATVIAGTLGMNMLPKYFLHSWVFWAGLAVMASLSGGLLLMMRLRKWL